MTAKYCRVCGGDGWTDGSAELRRDGRTGDTTCIGCDGTGLEPEPLTDKMIRDLRRELAAAGDSTGLDTCTLALGGDLMAREGCAEIINDERDDDYAGPHPHVIVHDY